MFKTPFKLRLQDRVAVFIDGAAFFKAHKGLGFDIDYKVLFDDLDKSCRLRSVTYYNMAPERETPAMSRLLNWMDFNGARTVVKPLRYEVNERGQQRERSTNKVEMGIDLVLSCSHHDSEINCDTLILFASDGDLTYAIERAQQRGARVIVVGPKVHREVPVDEDLRRQSDHFVDMDSIARSYAYVADQQKRFSRS